MLRKESSFELPGMSIALEELGVRVFGEIVEETDVISETFPLRRALASQFEICSFLRPVFSTKSSFSASEGYGCPALFANQPLRIFTLSLDSLVPPPVRTLVGTISGSTARTFALGGSGTVSCSLENWLRI
jgi:hypothetical protein